MFGLAGLCALLTVSLLLFILGFLVWNGARSINWAFFTELPQPIGEVHHERQDVRAPVRLQRFPHLAQLLRVKVLVGRQALL